jgi:hypothetical protein
MTADHTVPPVGDVQQRLALELSRAARIGHLLLLLTNVAIAIGVVSLLITEPVLPVRAQVALVLVLLIALSWVGFAWWTLTRRQVRLAGHDVIAGRMAVTYCGMLVGGSLVLTIVGPSPAAAGMSAAIGCVLLATAIVMLRRARRRLQQLRERRDALERMLRASPERGS